MYTISIEGKFSAAHSLRDYSGPCANIHGHNYKVVVSVECEKLDDVGMAIDFHDLKKITNSTLDQFDHKNLNEMDIFSYQNPTAEHIARMIYNMIHENLPPYVRLKSVAVFESDTCSVTYSENRPDNHSV